MIRPGDLRVERPIRIPASSAFQPQNQAGVVWEICGVCDLTHTDFGDLGSPRAREKRSPVQPSVVGGSESKEVTFVFVLQSS